MKPVDDELFAHIKERLTDHEEVYTPGAWERFEKKGGRKTGWIWITGLSSAAAVLLIGFALFYTGDTTLDKPLNKQVKHSPAKQDTKAVPGLAPQESKPSAAIENFTVEVVENKGIVEQRVNNHVPGNPLIVGIKDPATIKPTIVPAVQSTLPSEKGTEMSPVTIGSPDQKRPQGETVVSEVIAKNGVKEKDSVNQGKTRSFQEFLENEVKSNTAIAALKSSEKRADKWEMGLMVAPSMGNAKKLNMGYGLSMDYAISDKVSISSGIAYNEMGATKSMGGGERPMDSPAGAVAMVQETKSLKSVDANLVGIDIPLGIKYYLSKKFYTNVGVSAFAVLNQKQNNNYIKGGVEYAAAPDQAGFKAFFQERAVTEPVPSGEIRGDKYLGFYNLSFGFKQQISGSKAFSVEPFMKLPMKEFTKENLYLIGTGLRLKFDF